MVFSQSKGSRQHFTCASRNQIISCQHMGHVKTSQPEGKNSGYAASNASKAGNAARISDKLLVVGIRALEGQQHLSGHTLSACQLRALPGPYRAFYQAAQHGPRASRGAKTEGSDRGKHAARCKLRDLIEVSTRRVATRSNITLSMRLYSTASVAVR